jgi:ABC-2 type transport system permease protein
MKKLRKAWAFVVRDWHSLTSYRLAFLMNIGGIFLSIAVFFFISRLFGRAVNPFLAQYGGDYFAFVLIGLAVSGFMGTSLGVFASSIGSAQAQGTLEVMLVTPTTLSEIITMSSIWSFLFTSFNIIFYLSVGALVFGLRLAGANIGAAFLILLLIVSVFSGLGIISASFIMVLKRGDPVSWLFGSVSAIMSGTFFPIQVLPAWMQKFSAVFPLFYGLRAMRLALLQSASLRVLAPDILALFGFAAVILPISFLAFRSAVGRAKTDGSLATY